MTPSFNQAGFIEETIRSVLLQDYPHLEYIVMDGASTDGSVNIIRRYQDWLTSWVSEPDGGQADAINKGFARSTGDILAWLNSDDTYAPGALRAIAESFLHHPGAQMVYGDTTLIDADGQVIDALRAVPVTLRALVYDGCNLSQPAAFWTRSAFLEYGPLDARLRYCMEHDFFYRLVAHEKAVYLRRRVAALRIYEETKTALGGEALRQEWEGIVRRYTSPDAQRTYALKVLYRMRRYLLYLRQGDAAYLLQRAIRKVRGRLANRSGNV